MVLDVDSRVGLNVRLEDELDRLVKVGSKSDVSVDVNVKEKDGVGLKVSVKVRDTTG